MVADACEGGSCGLLRRRFWFWARAAELDATFVGTERKNAQNEEAHPEGPEGAAVTG
jgi:hypothetical protein